MTRPATGPPTDRLAVAGWGGLVVGGAVLAGALGGALADPATAVA